MLLEGRTQDIGERNGAGDCSNYERYNQNAIAIKPRQGSYANDTLMNQLHITPSFIANSAVNEGIVKECGSIWAIHVKKGDV